MNLEVIRHKTSRLFFEGFYPTEQIDSYAYQLERMFEQGSAVEGDLFVVSDDSGPILSLEIYRNNTRRILEKTPLIAIDRDLQPEEFIQAMNMIFDHLNDEVIAGSVDKELQVVIFEDQTFFTEYTDLLKNYKFVNIYDIVTYTINPDNIEIHENSDLSFTQLIESSVDERYELISKSTFTELLDRYSNDKVYMDLIEEGYQSEELWEFVSLEGKVLGFMMPIYTNGLKVKLELINYGLIDYSKSGKFYSALLERMLQIAKQNDVDEIILHIKTSDIEFIRIVERACSTSSVITKNYIRI